MRLAAKVYIETLKLDDRVLCCGLHREEDLPSHVLQRGSIQKGSVISFVRGPHGHVTASAGGQQLASVRSPHLAAALFDLYIGDQVRLSFGGLC